MGCLGENMVFKYHSKSPEIIILHTMYLAFIKCVQINRI